MRLSLIRSVAARLFVGVLLAGGALFPAGCAQEQEAPSPSQNDASQNTAQIQAPPEAPDTTVKADVPFVVTPQSTVNRMLELADVSPNDVVYDLGSGDGRIPIAAAERYDARGVGIEIKPELVQRARTNASVSGVNDKVEFRRQNLFEADFSEATVVTLYLFPEINIKLRPLLFEQLEPGTRVVSHSFDMDAWAPDSTTRVNGDRLYLWTIPEETPDFVKRGP
jgi:SAM-dependent methyltransferase